MSMKNVTKLILRRYLRYVPYQLRWAKFEALRRVGYVKGILQEIKPELEAAFPESTPYKSKALIEEEQIAVVELPQYIQPPLAHYPQYRCQQNNPLSCSFSCAHLTGDEATHTPDTQLSFQKLPQCQHCDFPTPIPNQAQLVGKHGQYKIEHRLSARGIGRQYSATKINADTGVSIREYLLPQRYFSRDEQKLTQETFSSVAGLSLADGRKQDLRVIVPIEAIADQNGQRCYLITPTFDNSPTLNQYCAAVGSLSPLVVVHILDQVLQTLTCLHQQKFAIPSGRSQTGFIHGNITLDSLLWVEPDKNSSSPYVLQGHSLESAPNQDLNNALNSHLSTHPNTNLSKSFIYLTDFALWDNLFDPTQANGNRPDYQSDLTGLGNVAYYLLNGTTLCPDGKSLNPRIDSNWPAQVPAPLKSLILRLIGIEAPFVSAEAARAHLLRLPQAAPISRYEHRADELLPSKTDWYKKAIPFLVTAAILMLGTGGWLLLRSRRPSYAGTPVPPCCLDAIAAIPQGDYTHVSPEAAYWYPLFRNTPETARSALSTTPTLFDRLKEIHPELSLNAISAPSIAEAVTTIQTGKADFAIVPLTEALPPDITSTIIAYDTLVPIVAFSYPERVQGLPDSLNGEISLSELKQIYNGTINHWQQISDAKLSIKRYWPEDKTALDFFHKSVFEEGEIAAAGYSNYARDEQGSFVSNRIQPESATSISMMRSILRDFENTNTGSIGVSPLSQVVGQCSVYPLALSSDGDTASPLIFNNGRAVKPESDLCDRKGSYQPNADAIRSGDYILSYPIAIIYPFDNTRADIGKKLASLLLTQESQQTLVSAGLVPAYLLPE